MKKAILVLENNTIFKGQGFGATGCFYCELVFNTAMTGYTEALTDPSYAGQILTFSYPLIGNYGIHKNWNESKKIHPVGIVVSEVCKDYSHRNADGSLDEILKKYGIGGIAGVDTRAIITYIRKYGCTPAVLSVYENKQIDHVKRVSTQSIKIINGNGKTKIALIDYGVKGSIVKELVKRNFKVIIFPATSVFGDILRAKPDGIILSNGPGDPAALDYAIKTVKELVKTNIPLFGICLGHQLLTLAAGGTTYKLKFGHRGLNQPVMNLKTKKSYLTSQNHGYAAKMDSLPAEWEILFQNINDGTVEGLIHKYLPIFSVQFHPEANPGPHDTTFLFDQFHSLL